MAPAKERLKELLLHPEEGVRYSSIKALRTFYRGEEGIVPAILHAIDQFDLSETIILAAAIRCFQPGPDDVLRIVQLFTDIEKNGSEREKHLQFHLIQALQIFPFSLLKSNDTYFRFHNDLSAAYQQSRTNDELRNEPADSLWKRLVTHCNSSEGAVFTPGGMRYGRLLMDGLARHREEISHKILMNLGRKEHWNDALEEYLVELAGELRLASSATDLINLFTRTAAERTLHGRIMKALSRIGGEELMRRLMNIYLERPDLRHHIASIYGGMGDAPSAEYLRQLLREEKSPGDLSFLVYALCDLYSKEGMEEARDALQRLGNDSFMRDMMRIFRPVDVYYSDWRRME